MLTEKFEMAFGLAQKLHANQYRKGSRVPFISHLLSVCALVLEDGGTEDEAIAALLHDAVEDQGGLETLEIIKKQFGGNVASIVMECSDAFTIPKPPWKQRKLEFIEKLSDVSESAVRVILADKIHNTSSIIRGYKKHGEKLWWSFKGDREGTIWYYEEVLNALKVRNESFLVSTLESLVVKVKMECK